VLVDRLYVTFHSVPSDNGDRRAYDWLHLDRPSKTKILNLSANPATEDAVCILQGEVAEIAGTVIDAYVLRHGELDRGNMNDGARILLPDRDFDVFHTDTLMEQAEHPTPFLSSNVFDGLVNSAEALRFLWPSVFGRMTTQ
jgi:hypothetical protein